MSEPLTPRQVVQRMSVLLDIARENAGNMDVWVQTAKHFGLPSDEEREIEEEHALDVTALEAALAAYKREHLRAWLEERRVSIEAYRPPGATWESAVWEIDAPKALWAELATVQAAHPGGVCGGGFATADAARAAAAKALGYPGLETEEAYSRD